MISKTEKALFLINNWRKMFIEYTSKIFHNPVPAKAGIMTDVKWRVFLQWKRNGKWCRWKLSFGITVLSICKIFNKRSKNFALFWKTYVNFIIWLHCTKCLQKMQQYLYINIEYAWKMQIALLWVYKEAPLVRDGAFFVYSCLKEIETYLYMY